MATLSIKESREFVIFQAFSQNDSYNAALDALEKYDRIKSSLFKVVGVMRLELILPEETRF